MALARSPADSNLIYGVANSQYLYRSDDAGPVAQEFFMEYSLPDGTPYGSQNGQLYKSPDEGATWAQAAVLPIASPITPPATGYLTYAASPLNPLLLYAWASGLAPPVVYISEDGGANWISRTLELTEIGQVVPSTANAAVAYASGAAP